MEVPRTSPTTTSTSGDQSPAKGADFSSKSTRPCESTARTNEQTTCPSQVDEPAKEEPPQIVKAALARPVKPPPTPTPIASAPVATPPKSQPDQPVANRRQRDASKPHKDASTSNPTDIGRSLTTEQLLAEITGPIDPVPTSLRYRLTAFLVAIVMILLPMFYVGLICGLLRGVYMHAIHSVGMLQGNPLGNGRGGFALLILYLGPIVAGSIAALFMIKPLFARPAKRQPSRSIPRETDPRLFAFIDALCEAVHAPRPKRIDTNCDINASASYGRGMLSVFTSNDLVLTTGMPLVAGLSVRQLAGVLAHEFGHFSQGFGMRLSYIIRSISFWFARVVYERDRWDELLASASQGIDIRIGIVLYIARFAIWFSRRILWVLMMIGNAVSSELLRQMEYDADMHEIRFAGSDNFASTAQQLRRLGIAMEQAFADQRELYVKKQLAGNMPELVSVNRDLQDDATVEKIAASLADEKTHWLATHPSDKDRICHAKMADAPGVFHLDMPASELFTNYQKLCVAVTQDLFEQLMGDELKTTNIVDNDHLLAHKASAQAAREAMQDIFGEAFNVVRPITIDFTTTPVATGDPARLSGAMADQKTNYVHLCKQLDEVDSKWIHCGSLAFLLDLGIKLNPKDFSISVNDVSATLGEQEACRENLQSLATEMEPFEKLFARRVNAALPVIRHHAEAGNAEFVELLDSIQPIAEAYPAIIEMLGEVTRLRNEFAQLAFFFTAVDTSGIDQTQLNALNAKGAKIHSAIRMIHNHFKTTSYPLQHAVKDMTIASYLVEVLPESQQDFGGILSSGQSFLEGYNHLYFSVIAELSRVVKRCDQLSG